MLQIIVTKRRLEFSISQLWAKIKTSFARISHSHPITDIADVAIVPDEEASEVIPIESATLQSIARGTYKQADTAMFTGHPDYIPLTAEEVTALVGTAMDAFRTAREIQEENE